MFVHQTALQTPTASRVYHQPHPGRFPRTHPAAAWCTPNILGPLPMEAADSCCHPPHQVDRDKSTTPVEDGSDPCCRCRSRDQVGMMICAEPSCGRTVHESCYYERGSTEWHSAIVDGDMWLCRRCSGKMAGQVDGPALFQQTDTSDTSVITQDHLNTRAPAMPAAPHPPHSADTGECACGSRAPVEGVEARLRAGRWLRPRRSLPEP